MSATSTHPSKQPLYVRIADDLRDAIRRGLRRDGQPTDMLPGEHQLATEYAVSVGTVRSALKLLQDEGLITRTPGRTGTRVAVQFDPKAPKHVRRGQERLTGRSEGRDPQPHQFMWFDVPDQKPKPSNFKSGIRMAGLHETVVLGCFGSMRRLIYRQRIYVAGDVPLYSATNFLPVSLFPDEGQSILQQDTGPGGLWARLADAGHRVREATEYVDTRMPTEQEIKELRIPPGVPIFVVYRIAEDRRGRVVDLATITLPGHRWRLQYVVLSSRGLLFRKKQRRLQFVPSSTAGALQWQLLPDHSHEGRPRRRA